jgi:hypothetical protein
VDVPDQRFVTPEGSLSFAGATFTYEEVARVRVTAATSGLESCGSTTDCVAMDDFIFGEAKPVPVPPAIALLGAAIAGMGILGRRSRKA